MKKNVVLFCSMILVCSILQAQVRSFVGIVRPVYHEDTIKFLESFKDDLKKDGYKDYAKYIEDYLKGGFGSGFIYVADNGANYVITNRHVIAQGDSVSVEFENEDGSTTTYKNMKILYADEDIDLAILSFEDNKRPFKSGIPLDTSSMEDGAEIWTAGYPALDNEPLWQLGKGSVTNSRAKVKDLVDPEISTLIQHSAQIDSGNSGGPLLIKSSSKCGYSVVGINTWKVVDRQDTNYAIPAKAISDFLSRALDSNKSVSVEDAVTARAKKFAIDVSEKENTFVDIAKYISYDYVSKEGTKAFKRALKDSSVKIPKAIVECFAYSPIEGMRYSLAYLTWMEFHNQKAKSVISIPTIADLTVNDDNKVTVNMTVEKVKKPVKLIFAKEYGNWEIDFVNDGVEFATSFLYFPKDSFFGVDYDIGFGDAKSAFSIGYQRGSGYSLSGAKFKVAKLADSYYDDFNNEQVDKAVYSYGAYFETGFIVPMNFKKVYVMPYLQGECGVWLSPNSKSAETLGASAGGILGCYICPEFGWAVKPLLNVAYDFRYEVFQAKVKNFVSVGLDIAF